MKTILDSESIVGTTTVNGEPMEVCSEAECLYLSANNELRARLESFLRPENPSRVKEGRKIVNGR